MPEVQGQAQTLCSGERCSQSRNTRTVAGANDVIGAPLTIVNVRIKVGSPRTNCGVVRQRYVRKTVETLESCFENC